MDHGTNGPGTDTGMAPTGLRTEPALPAGALAALERSVSTNGRGPGSLARRLGPLTSLLVLGVAAAAGFIGGVQVQKHEGGTTAVAAGAGATGGGAARAAAGGAGPATTAGGAGGGPGTTAPAGDSPSTVAGGPAPGPGAGGPRGAGGAAAGAGGARAGAGAAGPATAGQVKLVDGNTLYVTDAQGNVVKVLTTPASRFTKTGAGSIQDVRPGDTVVVQGQRGEDGVVTATAVANSGPAAGS